MNTGLGTKSREAISLTAGVHLHYHSIQVKALLFSALGGLGHLGPEQASAHVVFSSACQKSKGHIALPSSLGN